MKKKPDFTSLSAQLVQNHRAALISLLQQSGVLMPANASDSQLINAYLVAVADNPGFRDALASYVVANGTKNVDGAPATPTITTASTTAPKDSLLNTILGSASVNTLLSGASNYLNSQQTLKEQANQIKEAQLNLQNNQVVATANATGTGATKPAGALSTGTVILIVVGALIAIGGIILIVSKKPAAQVKPVKA